MAWYKEWIMEHRDCLCSEYTFFTVEEGHKAVQEFHDFIAKESEGLIVFPNLRWVNDSDISCSLPCRILSEGREIEIGDGSCVNWISVFIAYVHALSHALEMNTRDVRTDEIRHTEMWKRVVE